jgi:hypothetical protein
VEMRVPWSEESRDLRCGVEFGVTVVTSDKLPVVL